MMLEVGDKIFENASLTPPKLQGKNVRVYAGQWIYDYAKIPSRNAEFPATYHTRGVGPVITFNRMSNNFNLQGPSFRVDTGCSSSLVALHLAVQNIRAGEIETGIVGGVNLLLDPYRFIYQSNVLQ